MCGLKVRHWCPPNYFKKRDHCHCNGFDHANTYISHRSECMDCVNLSTVAATRPVGHHCLNFSPHTVGTTVSKQNHWKGLGSWSMYCLPQFVFALQVCTFWKCIHILEEEKNPRRIRHSDQNLILKSQSLTCYQKSWVINRGLNVFYSCQVYWKAASFN